MTIPTLLSFILGATVDDFATAHHVFPSIGEGVKRAREAVASGKALAKLSQFVAATQKLKA